MSLAHGTAVQVIVTILVILVIQMIVRGSVEHLVERTIRHHHHETEAEGQKRQATLNKIFHTAFAVTLWTVGIIVILAEIHVHIAALVTGAGLVGVVVGLGAQSTIKDFLGGIFIITENQFRVGDIVTLSAGTPLGVSGIVEDITIRITKLRDQDGNLHIVPNGSAGIITNQSFKFSNVNLDINISYETDIAKVEKIINDVGIDLAGDEKWGASIVEAIHFLRVNSFGDSYVTVKALGKVKPGTQWDIAGAFRRQLKQSFEKHDIVFPTQQVTIHDKKK